MTMNERFLSRRNGALLCPKCDGDFVHIDDVYVSGRPREDSEIRPVHVDHRGHVTEGPAVALPFSSPGRRHAFAFRGWCETCKVHFVAELVQHKGQTLVALSEATWTPLVRE